MKKKFLLSLSVLFILVACEPTFTPKPRGYNHIDLPEHEYVKWLDTTKPYSFEIFKGGIVKPYVTELVKEEQDWVIIDYPELQSSLWVTYYDLHNSIDTLNKNIATSFKLTDKHNVKATGMDSEVLSQEKGKYAVGVTIEGEVPSQYQFFLHDSTSNFLRVALYFNTSRKNDSLAPVIDYMKEDMMHIIKTVEWKEDVQ